MASTLSGATTSDACPARTLCTAKHSISKPFPLRAAQTRPHGSATPSQLPAGARTDASSLRRRSPAEVGAEQRSRNGQADADESEPGRQLASRERAEHHAEPAVCKRV